MAACGLHLVAQGLHMQHMAIYAAYGCWLAGHRGHTDLRQHVKWCTGGPYSKQHYCKQQAAIQQYSKLHAVSCITEAAMLPTCQNCRYCHTANSNLPELQGLQYCKVLSICLTASWPQGAGGYIYIYIFPIAFPINFFTPIP